MTGSHTPAQGSPPPKPEQEAWEAACRQSPTTSVGPFGSSQSVFYAGFSAGIHYAESREPSDEEVERLAEWFYCDGGTPVVPWDAPSMDAEHDEIRNEHRVEARAALRAARGG